jgi:hypothetical protein
MVTAQMVQTKENVDCCWAFVQSWGMLLLDKRSCYGEILLKELENMMMVASQLEI